MSRPSEITEEDAASLLEVIDDFVEREVADRAAELDRTGQFPDDFRRAFGEMGLMGLQVPSEYGGAGAGLKLTIEVVTRIARTCANTANIVSQQGLGLAAILDAGSEEQKLRLLPKLASGEHLAAFALTEAGAGSDNRSMSATARRVGDNYVIDGVKQFCSWGNQADIITVFANAIDDPDGEGVVALVVERPAEGLEVVRLEEKMGLHACPTAQLSFTGVTVPLANRLGKPGDGIKIALRGLNAGRVEISALALGIAQGALDYSSRYLTERKQFGQALAEFQGLRFKVADSVTALRAAELMILDAADKVENNHPDVVLATSAAKLFATDAAWDVVNDSLGLLGGYGYIREYPLERMLRDVKVCQLVEGTNEIQRVVIANQWFRGLK